jgi:hypothetical protein
MITLTGITRIRKTIIEHHHYHHEHIIQPEPLWPRNPWSHPTFYCTSAGLGSPATPSFGELTCKMSTTTGGVGMASETIKSNVEIPAQTSQDVPDFNLGTGWGSEREDKVNLVDFKRSLELCSMELYYSDAEGLKRSGIEVDKKPAITKPSLPKGFNGFCVPPKVTKTTA